MLLFTYPCFPAHGFFFHLFQFHRSFKGDPGYIITAAELEQMEKEAMRREARIGKQQHRVGGGVLGEAIAYARSDLPPLASPPGSTGGLDHRS